MINSLTGLRAVAALLVFLFHASVFRSGDAVFIAPGFDNGIVRSGDFGVDIFFVLSGFVIAHVYAERLSPFQCDTYGKFIWFRIARLLPTHLFTMGLMLAAFIVASRVSGQPASEHDFQFEVQSILASLLMVHEWFAEGNFISRIPAIHQLLSITGQIGTPNTVSWSISSEFIAYLFFPAVLAIAKHLCWRSAVASTVVTGIALSSMSLIPSDNIVRVLYCFTTGVVLQKTLLSFSGAPSWSLPIPQYLHGLSFVFLLAATLSLFRTANGGLAYLLAVVLVALLIGAICKQQDLVGRALSTRAMVYLGEISYGFYMIHWFVIKLIERVFRMSIGIDERTSLVFMLVSLVTSIMFAAAIYRYLEHPARSTLQGLYLRRHALGGNSEK